MYELPIGQKYIAGYALYRKRLEAVMLAFEYGSTRYVFCVGNVAIKVARVKALYWILRLLKFQREGGVIQKVTTTSKRKKFAALKHLFAGVFANIEEFRFYQKYPSLPIAPTLFSLFGLVNIQVRGEIIERDELTQCPFREVAGDQYDLNHWHHFGRINGTVHLLDYGFEDANALISQSVGATQATASYT